MHPAKDSIEATTRAVTAADQAYLDDAIESGNWQRRGLLQRLRRAGRPEGLRFQAGSLTRTPVLEAAF